MGLSAAMIAKVASATPPGGGVFLQHGRYMLVVKKIEAGEKYKGVVFLVEFRIEWAEPYEAGQKVNPVGSYASVAWNFTKHPDTAPGNTKGFLATLEGADANSLTLEQVQYLSSRSTSPDQPYKGYLIGCDTYQKPTRDQAKVLTLPRWSHVPEDGENSAEKVAARRATLG